MISRIQQRALVNVRRNRRERQSGGQPQNLNNSWFFTAGRLRLPNALGVVEAGEEYTAHKSMWISDDFPQNYFYIGIANWYTDNTGAEQVGAHAFDLVGCAMHAFYGGTWKIVTPISVALANPVNFPVGVSKLIGPFIFPDWVPAESQMAIILRINTTAGASLPTSIKLRNGTNEGASRTVVASDFHLTATGALGGSDGRFSGEVMGPAFVIAKPQNPLDRPVFLIGDDSISWGKNSNENVLPGTTYGSMGGPALAMDSKVGKRRYPYSNWANPGAGPEDVQPKKDALIRLCPNRPYTHILSNHLNNIGGTGEEIRLAVQNWAEKRKEDSQLWGDAPAPVYYLGVLPKPGSTNWCTDLAGQGSSGINYPGSARYLFEAELLAGRVNNIDVVIKNERLKYDLASERDRWKLTGFSTTITTNYVSGSTTMIVAANPGVGSMIVADPGGVNGARHVQTVTGSGPYTLSIESGITSATLLVGVTVKTTFAGDNGAAGGTHPNSAGHVQWGLDIAEHLATLHG